MTDPNRELGAFVEGMVMGAIDQSRLSNCPGGWKAEAMVPDPTGVYALYFISPTGIRWRIRAEIEDRPIEGKGKVPPAGMTKAAGW